MNETIEIVSEHDNGVLVSAEDYAALREGSYLLRSSENARRLLKAYENALANVSLSERELADTALDVGDEPALAAAVRSMELSEPL